MKYVGYGCLFLCVIYIFWKARSFYLKDERLKAKYRIKEDKKDEKKKK